MNKKLQLAAGIVAILGAVLALLMFLPLFLDLVPAFVEQVSSDQDSVSGAIAGALGGTIAVVAIVAFLLIFLVIGAICNIIAGSVLLSGVKQKVGPKRAQIVSLVLLLGDALLLFADILMISLWLDLNFPWEALVFLAVVFADIVLRTVCAVLTLRALRRTSAPAESTPTDTPTP